MTRDHNDDRRDDIEIEGRLALAGTRWREAQPPPPEPDLARMTGRPRHRALATTAAAAAVAVLAVGTVTMLGGGGGGGTAAPPTPSTNNLRDLDRFVVHNGDTVKVNGSVFVKPGNVTLCLDAAYDAKHPACSAQGSIRLYGVDVRQLPPPAVPGDPETRTAEVVGTWRNRSITVTSLGPEPDPSSRPTIPPLRPACPAPGGGWQSGPLADRHALDTYVAADPDRFGGTDVAYPQGLGAPGPTGPNGYTDVPQVIVVYVATGDLAGAQADLAQRFHGNLCVQRGEFSARQLAGAEAAVQHLQTALNFDVAASGAGPTRTFAYVPVVDDAIYPKLAAIEDRYGIGILQLATRVVPIR